MQANSQQPEGAVAVRSGDLFCVGDRVTWMKTCKAGSGYSFSNREGKIIRIEGDKAVLQMRNGRKTWEMLADLTKAGETNAVTKLFNAMTGESAQPTQNAGTQRTAAAASEQRQHEKRERRQPFAGVTGYADIVRNRQAADR